MKVMKKSYSNRNYSNPQQIFKPTYRTYNKQIQQKQYQYNTRGHKHVPSYDSKTRKSFGKSNSQPLYMNPLFKQDAQRIL